MLLNKYTTVDILSCRINVVNYKNLLDEIDNTIKNKISLFITGANAHTINYVVNNKYFNDYLQVFSLVHFDGIGVFLAIRFLYPEIKSLKRITGSDFYKELIFHSIKRKYSFYFFGDTFETLSLLQSKNPRLNINGFNPGFEFDTNVVIDKINNSNSDILIVGLGSGLQEKWIAENKSKIKAKVIIAVGDGIKVFSGTKKRGPKLIQKLGLEWFVRFLYEPKRLFKRYFFGIPLFIFRVIKFKFFYSKNG